MVTPLLSLLPMNLHDVPWSAMAITLARVIRSSLDPKKTGYGKFP